MIDFVFGKKNNPVAVDTLVKYLSTLDNVEGTLYIGYPMFESSDHAMLTDALLITKNHGVIIFDLNHFSETNKDVIYDYQDELYRGVFQKFLSQSELLKRRKLIFDINIVSISSIYEHIDDEGFCKVDSLQEYMSSLNPIDDSVYKQINATVQKTDVLKPNKKRINVTREDSFGGMMKKIEKEIANLDSWQKKAAIESPEKPQRIRGLAGSGKTIILSMKAAYLHAFEEEKRIAVTFQTRTLYQQFKRLIEKFYFDHRKDEPNYELLTILHAWGGIEKGVYSEICNHVGFTPLSWSEAKSKFGQEDAFKEICRELLEYVEKNNFDPIYDYVLIDEAQDFPEEFFRLVYKFTRDPKKVIWAYDELQNLGEYQMLPPEKLFGSDKNNSPLVTLDNSPDKPQQDIMLPICYRNPPWTLTLALSLGLGIYRSAGLVRMFKEPKFWTDIGFETVSGRLKLGNNVKLQRSRSRTPEFFYEYMSLESAIILQQFKSDEEQAKWVAAQIKRDITTNELEPSDILVIYPVPYTLIKASSYLTYELRTLNINSHIIGKDVSRDVVFKDNSVAITHIHRAKGNEAAMVYVMNAHYYHGGLELGKKRNSLFTAITRTKAWVRICGIGDGMSVIMDEHSQLEENNYNLSFKYPNAKKIDIMESAYGDSTDEQKEAISSSIEQVKKLKEMIDSGKITVDDLPDDIKGLFGE